MNFTFSIEKFIEQIVFFCVGGREKLELMFLKTFFFVSYAQRPVL